MGEEGEEAGPDYSARPVPIREGDIAAHIALENEKTLARARLPSELIVNLEGTVSDVNSYTIPINSAEGEIIVGGSRPLVVSGYQSRLEFQLREQKKSDPIKIIFDGYSDIVNGDKVTVGIFASEEELFNFGFGGLETKSSSSMSEAKGRVFTKNSGFNDEESYILVSREIKSEERAGVLYIKRESSKVKGGRTDFSVHYDKSLHG